MSAPLSWPPRCAFALLGALTAACGEPAAELRESGLTLRYLDGCTPSAIDQITIEALGDYPPTDSSFVSLRAADGATRFRSLPLLAQEYRVVVSTSSARASALAPAADESARFDALVMPLGTPCLVTKQRLNVPGGASVAVTASGDLLIAGGIGEAGARAGLVHYVVARQRAHNVAGGLFVARTQASAVRVGDELWLIGGTSQELPGSTALGSFERYDAATRTVTELGRLEHGRIQPGVLALSDGSVLVAGGRAILGGTARDDMERVAAGGQQSRRLTARLPRRLAAPALLARDDGLVWIVGDDDEELVVALYDPALDVLEEIEPPPGESAAAFFAALPGSRLCAIELRDGVTTGVLFVWSERFGWLRRAGSLTSFAGLSAPTLAVLRNGELLLTGQDGGGASARVIDPGLLTVAPRSIAHTVERILVRDDGAALLLGSQRLSLLREEDGSAFDNPAGTLLDDEAHLVAVDSGAHWRQEGLSWRALTAFAELEVRSLSYLDARFEVEVSGAAELLLRQVGGATRSVSVGGKRVGPLLCELSAPAGERLRVTRRGEQLRLEIAGRSKDCVLTGMVGRLSLGVRALRRGAEVRWLSAERL